MRFDPDGTPVSNMDEVTLRNEGGDLVAYGCYGDVLYRIRTRMQQFQVTINAVSTVTVEADNAEDAEQAARDIFRISTADSVNVEVIREGE